MFPMPPVQTCVSSTGALSRPPEQSSTLLRLLLRCTCYGQTTASDLPLNCVRRPPEHKIKNRDEYWVFTGWDRSEAAGPTVFRDLVCCAV